MNSYNYTKGMVLSLSELWVKEAFFSEYLNNINKLKSKWN